MEESETWAREAQNTVSRAVQMVLEETQKSPGNRSDHEFLVGIGALLETGLKVTFFFTFWQRICLHLLLS